MIYRTFSEWKQDGYIVKKGEHATKVSDDHKPEYLFSEEQVTPVNKPKTDFIDSVDSKVWEELAKIHYPKIKQLLKDNFNICTEDDDGKCKSFSDVLNELSKKYNESI